MNESRRKKNEKRRQGTTIRMLFVPRFWVLESKLWFYLVFKMKFMKSKNSTWNPKFKNLEQPRKFESTRFNWCYRFALEKKYVDLDSNYWNIQIVIHWHGFAVLLVFEERHQASRFEEWIKNNIRPQPSSCWRALPLERQSIWPDRNSMREDPALSLNRNCRSPLIQQQAFTHLLKPQSRLLCPGAWKTFPSHSTPAREMTCDPS